MLLSIDRYWAAIRLQNWQIRCLRLESTTVEVIRSGNDVAALSHKTSRFISLDIILNAPGVVEFLLQDYLLFAYGIELTITQTELFPFNCFLYWLSKLRYWHLKRFWGFWFGSLRGSCWIWYNNILILYNDVPWHNNSNIPAWKPLWTRLHKLRFFSVPITQGCDVANDSELVTDLSLFAFHNKLHLRCYVLQASFCPSIRIKDRWLLGLLGLGASPLVV